MSDVETVSAKISRAKKRRMKELGINASDVIRKAVDREIARKEWEQVFQKLEEARPILKKASKESWLKAIRESRDEE